MDQDLCTIQGNQPPKMLVGTDEFYDLVLNSDVFVDKSLLIKELLENSSKVLLITRPRRWGKSLNMNMIKKFFEIEVDAQGKPLPTEQKANIKLFLGGSVAIGFGETKILKSLKIAHHPNAMKRQGQFPVISINFKDVKGNSYQEIEDGIRNQITKLFDAHYYLNLTKDIIPLGKAHKEKLSRYFDGTFTKEDLKDSLGFLSALLFKHFDQKVYILIDEYDTPINSSYIKFSNKSEEFEQVLELFRGLRA